MRLERDHLFDSGHFANAPTLIRLLAFLVERTLAGQGDQLKSYSVAVDGLGRDPDFDSQADSYPRVQVVRLRKLLEAFYARYAAAEQMCIFLKSGSYRVRLAPLATAYPELARAHPVAPMEALSDYAVAEEIVMPAAPVSSDSNLSFSTPPFPGIERPAGSGVRYRIWPLLVGILLLSSIALVTYLFRSPSQHETTQIAEIEMDPPVLLLEPVRGAGDVRSVAIADDIYALLADGIRRSWLVRLRLDNVSESTASTAKPTYRMTVQLGEASGDRRPIYVRLSDYETSNMLWSGTVRIKSNEPLSESLGQTIARLAGPFGVIAARETRITDGRYRPGYSCLLGYLDNKEFSNSKAHQDISLCLARANSDAKLDAVRLAFQSFYTVEAQPNKIDRQNRIPTAMKLARQSVNADPTEAYAHFAMARIYFVAGKCPIGQKHSRYAVDANPYDPVILAVLGNFVAMCGYDEGLVMLDKAYSFRSPGESRARLALILAAIWQKRLDRLEALRKDGEEAETTSVAYHYLCETLIAAALDETATAQDNWKKFKSASLAESQSDDATLRSVIMSAEVRTRILGFLKQKNVL